MATIFTHTVVATTLGKTYTAQKLPRDFWIWSILCSILPDIDVFGFPLGIQYGAFLGHRGFTHSLFFALIVGLLVAFAVKRIMPSGFKWWSLWIYFFVVTASHGFLDALTDGGLGIAFFSPFETTRYFLPWQPLYVSPVSLFRFISPWGWKVLKNEMIWVWGPCCLLLCLIWIVRKIKSLVAGCDGSGHR